MLFLNAIASFAAFAACIMPVLSAPVAEPNTSETSLIVKRGVLSTPAQICHDQVKSKCDEISAQIDVVVKIDATVAANIVVKLKAIVKLIVALGVELQAKISAGGLIVADVRACITIIIAIVKLCASILLKIAAHLAVNVSVFATVVVELAACIRLVVNLLISVCLGQAGGLSLLDLTLVASLVVQLTACLAAFISACVTLGIAV